MQLLLMQLIASNFVSAPQVNYMRRFLVLVFFFSRLNCENKNIVRTHGGYFPKFSLLEFSTHFSDDPCITLAYETLVLDSLFSVPRSSSIPVDSHHTFHIATSSRRFNFVRSLRSITFHLNVKGICFSETLEHRQKNSPSYFFFLPPPRC